MSSAKGNDLCVRPEPTPLGDETKNKNNPNNQEEEDQEKLRKWLLQSIFGDSSKSISSILKEKLVATKYNAPLLVYVGLSGEGSEGERGVTRERFEFWFEGEEDCRFLISSLPFFPAKRLPPCPPFADGTTEEVPFDISFSSLQKKAQPLDLLSKEDLEKESIEGMNTDLSLLLPLSLKCCAEWIGYCCSSLVWKKINFVFL